MGAEWLLLGASSGKVSAAAASTALAARSVGTVASLQHGRRLGPVKLAALRQRGCAWRWQHNCTTLLCRPQVVARRRRGWEGGIREGDSKTRHRPQSHQGPEGHRPLHRLWFASSVRVASVPLERSGKDGDLSQKFWSTKDRGQRQFTFTIGLGSVIKGWDEGVLTMQVGEVARITCTPAYGYGASGFPLWGILPNSMLVFEIEVLSTK